jgi:hypothetical protein
MSQQGQQPKSDAVHGMMHQASCPVRFHLLLGNDLVDAKHSVPPHQPEKDIKPCSWELAGKALKLQPAPDPETRLLIALWCLSEMPRTVRLIVISYFDGANTCNTCWGRTHDKLFSKEEGGLYSISLNNLQTIRSCEGCGTILDDED